MSSELNKVSIRSDEENEVKEDGTAASRYAKLETNRFPHLNRARDCAKYTIPMLMPIAGHNNTTKFTTPYQGIGARGVNTLASKLLLALLPPNQPFFKLQVADEVLKEFGVVRGEVEAVLSSIERAAMDDINSSNARMVVFEAMKQLICSGNVLLHLPEKTNQIRVFRMDRYVVRRDTMGNVLEIVIREDINPEMLSEDILKQVGLDFEDDTTRNLPLYTRIEKSDEDENKYESYQEINGVVIEGSYALYPKEKLPYLPLRLIAVDNEDYGRSYVEEYLGDLKSLEGLTKAIVEGSAAAAKLVFMVNPNGLTKKKDLVESKNLAVITGMASDVTSLQAQKQADFRIALDTASKITERLGYAFLLNTAVQRPGERVTAEEIRYMARELEDALGGIYSVLTQEFQLPLLTIILDRLQKRKAIPKLPQGIVKPAIITGMEAIGRSQDLERLHTFVQLATQLGAAAQLNMDEIMSRVGAAIGIDTKGLVKSKEQIAQEQQAAQKAAMMQQAVPGAVKGLADIASNAQQAALQQQGTMQG